MSAPRYIYLCAALFIIGAPASAQQTYDIATPLSFGSFGVIKNDAVYEMTISENNDLTQDNAFIVSSPPPNRGEMLLENLPINTEIIITFGDGEMARDGGPATPTLDIVDFTTDQPTPAQYTSDGSGRLTVLYGATLRTSGDGGVYASGAYTGSYEVTIDF